MTNMNQTINKWLKSKLLMLFPVPPVIVFLTGIILGWGALNISGALSPVSFYSFSNLAATVESLGGIFQTPQEEIADEEFNAPLQDLEDISAPVEQANVMEAVLGNTSKKDAASEPAVPSPKKPSVVKPIVPVQSAGGTSSAPAPKTGVKSEKTFVYYSTGPMASDPKGIIDLEGRILEVGVVDKDTNVFTASSSPSANSRIAVRFEVVSKGTKASGSWTFNAVLPTMPLYIYSGDSQQSLMPGDKIEFTIGFDSVERKKDAEFTVNVDPTGSVVESNESNNIVKTLIQPAY